MFELPLCLTVRLIQLVNRYTYLGVNIAAYLPKARILKQAETAVTGEAVVFYAVRAKAT